MQITDDVNVPDKVVDALNKGKLVFFVGAGASLDSPSNFPTFQKLTEELSDLACTEHPAKGANLDEFIGRLPKGFDAEEQTRQIFADETAKPNKTHQAIVKLASFNENGAPRPKIITTNYDTLLEQAAEQEGTPFTKIYTGPALPNGGSFNGLVHLHGCHDERNLHLVLSDKNFAEAYLTKAWATRFLLELFNEYLVVFIGYSHDDIMMRYLALGLPAKTERYTFVSEQDSKENAQKWGSLGIIPISYPTYPIAGTARKDHSALHEALEKWGEFLYRTRSSNDSSIGDIVKNGVTMARREEDYLLRQLHTSSGAFSFAQNARSDEKWLEWILHQEDFTDLIGNQDLHPDKEYEKIILDWFITNFAENPERQETVLELIEHGQISYSLYDSLCRSVHSLNASGHGNEAIKLGSVLASSVPGQTLPRRQDSLLYSYAGSFMPFPVLTQALTPFLHGHSIHWSLDRMNIPELRKQLQAQVDDEAINNEQLLAVLENSLLRAYQLEDSLHKEAIRYDSLGYGRNSIEDVPSDQRYARIQDVIVDTLRDIGEQFDESEATGIIRHWWNLGYPLFQRLSVHLMNKKQTHISPDEKIKWVLDEGLLFSLTLKHEVYALLRENILSAGKTTLTTLLEQTLDGPQDEYIRDIRSAEYEKYNLLVWLAGSLDSWAEAATARDGIAKDQGFAPLSHPDLDIPDEGTISGDMAPLPDKDFRERADTDPTELISYIFSLHNRDEHDGIYHEMNFEGALHQVESLCISSPELGLQLWESTLENTSNTDRRTALLQTIIQAWSMSQLGDLLSNVLNKLDSTVSDPSYTLVLARFLEKQVETSQDSLSSGIMNHMRKLANNLWDRFADTYVPLNPDMDPVYKALNEWPGLLAIFWVLEIQIAHREATPRKNQLEACEKEALHKLLSPQLSTYMSTVPAIAEHVAHLYFFDSEFTVTNVFPLFQDETSSYPAWKAYLSGCSSEVTDTMIRDGFGEVIMSIFLIFSKLEINDYKKYDPIMKALNSPALPKSQSNRLLDKVITDADPLALCLSTAYSFSHCTQPDDKQKLWELWIHDFIVRRFNGVPRTAKPEELRRWAAFSFLLDNNSFAEMRETMDKNNPGLDNDSLTQISAYLEDVDSWTAEKTTLLIQLIKNSRNPDTFMSYQLSRLIEQFQQQISEDQMALLLSTAYDTGFNVSD